jgi:hypothetical protein
LSIIGDVPSFVDCVYYDHCGCLESPRSAGGESGARRTRDDTFTIGGAVYTDLDNPLTSGLEGVEVTVDGDGGTFTAFSQPQLGLWVVEDVPAGTYTVTPSMENKCFEHVFGGIPDDQTSTLITVDEDHQAENQSIQFLAGDRSVADFDADCDVDLVDYQHLQSCLTGPSVPPSGGCDEADLDGDLDVDLGDFTAFQLAIREE